jgi:hypothetical protein
MVWRIDEHGISADKLTTSLDAWPNASRGLAGRIAALREKAQSTGFCGITVALRGIVAKSPRVPTAPNMHGRA